MKSLCLYLVAGGISFLSACSRTPAETPYYENQWTKIDKLLLEDSFQPSETRTISLQSEEPRHIQFITNLSYELSMKQKSDGTSGIKLSSEDHPDEYVSTTFGAATLFTPENGTIRLKITNYSDLSLRIAVYIIHEQTP